MVVREMRLGLHAAYIHDWCVQVSLHQLQHINFKFEFLSPDPVPFFPNGQSIPTSRVSPQTYNSDHELQARRTKRGDLRCGDGAQLKCGEREEKRTMLMYPPIMHGPGEMIDVHRK